MLDPGTSTWLGATPVVAVALVLIFLPGLVAARLLRVPWLAAFAVAPALSTTAIVLITVTSTAAGVSWGPLALLGGVLGVWLIVAALGAWLGRHATAEAPEGLPIAVLVVTTLAAIAVGLVLLPVSGTPEAFPQHPDTIFHLGVAQWMVEHQDASFLHAEAFRGLSVPYQAAFHAMVATTAQLTGTPAVVSTSGVVLVSAGFVWPLGCVFLARTLFGSDLAVTISAGVTSVAFSAFPFALMGYGVLWPNLFGIVLVPAALALLAIALSAAHRRSPPLTSRLRATVLLLITIPGLAVAHPNALVTFLLFGYLMAAGIIVRKAWELRSDRPRLAAATVTGLILVSGLGFLVTIVAEPKGGGMRHNLGIGPELTQGEAISDTLLFAPRGAAGLWVLAALVAVGVVIILLGRRGRRWLVAAALITSTLFYLNVAVDSPAVRLFTWPWNMQAPRLAAMAVLPAMLLATVALAAAARFLTIRLGVSQQIAAVAVPLLFVVVTGGAYLGAHRSVLDPFFNPTPARSWASKEELQALHALAQHVPPDTVVAENPWNGGSYMYVVSGRQMLFPTEGDRTYGDRTLLAMSLDDVGRSPEVCAAARRLNVRFAITGGRPAASFERKGSTLYTGIDKVRSSRAFRKVAREGPYTLYRMVRCAKAKAKAKG